MKIISIHIYGFGQLADINIDNLSDFQVFYGENEAGKSTIMAFIHAVLFGFPSKQQTELRYEPKHNSNYGGRIKIVTDEFGFVFIERIKGKAAAGDVTVTTSTGAIGGENLLKKVLSNVDKGLFQSIFSFNLHGLQNIHQMKSEDIGRFLFSAGTLGTDRLAIAESELQKQLDARFKPGGKKPLLNGKLQDLNQLNRELKDAASKNQEYEGFIQQKNTIQQEIEETKRKLQQIREKVGKLNEWKKIETFVKEQKWVEQELVLIGEVSYPPRGIERFEKMKPLIASTEARMLSIEERIAQLNKELEVIQPNKKILERESEILQVVDKYPLFKQWNSQEKEWQIRLQQYEEKSAEIKEKLHLSLQDEEILSINTNIYMREQAEKLSRKGQALEEVKQQLDIRFNEEKNALEKMEDDIRFIETKVIPEEERKVLESQVNESLDKNNLELKLQAVRDKIAIYKKAEQQEKTAAARLKKQKQIQFLLFALLFSGFIFYGLFSKQSVPLLLGGVGFFVVATFLIMNMRQPARAKEQAGLTALMQEEQQLMQHFQSQDFRKMADLQEKLALDNHYRGELQVLKIQLEQQQNQYEKVIKGYEEWEADAAAHQADVRKICRQLAIPEYMANSFLSEAFGMIEQYKSTVREMKQIKENLTLIRDEQGKVLDKLNQLIGSLLEVKNMDSQEAVYFLRNKLKGEQEKNIQWQEKQKKLADLNADLGQIKQEQQHLTAELNLLLQTAKVENETEFYELGAKAEKKRKLLERQEDLEQQLHYSLLSDLERESFLQIIDGDEIINRHRQEELDLQSHLMELQEQQASIKYEIQILEEGGLYSELLHLFKEKKYEFEEDAKEWSVYCLAQKILLKTVEKYKSVHLPRMLSKAEEFLAFLTDGNYQQILLNQAAPGFLIVHKDQTIFEANELSQATTEQVYVSIRLALAVTIYEKYHFPIIIDDSFVNFDRKRTQKMIELLKSFKQNQILFFTCHEHLLNYFNKESILTLSQGEILAFINE